MVLRFRERIVNVEGVNLKMDRRLSNKMVNVLSRGHHSVEEKTVGVACFGG